MELREYAAREVSALIDRLVLDADERTDARIDTVQHEHDAAMTSIRLEFEAQIEGIRRDHAAAMAPLRLKLQAQTQELEATSGARDHLAAAVEQTRSQLDMLRREFDAQRSAFETQRQEAELLQHRLAASNAAAGQELQDVRAALETERREAELQRRLAATNNASAEHDLLEARTARDAAQAEGERLKRQFDSALDELRDEHRNTLQEQALARTVLPLDELLTVFGSLASSSTPSAVLTSVVSGLAREFSRVALFRLRGSRLECVSHVGFEFEGDIAKVVIPTSVDSLMARAVTSRRTQSFVTGTSDEGCSAPFGGAPACAVALPLISGEATVAVVYADDSDQLEFGAVPAPLLVKFAELVWQHAILVLQRASASQKTLAVTPSQSFERLA